MRFRLRRETPATGLDLARAHALVVKPRRGTIRWEAFDRGRYDAASLAAAAGAWRDRARQEFHSLALFTQLASQVHLIGAPLDWAGAFVRMTADEVRHTELCARMASILAGEGAESPPARLPEIDADALHLPVRTTSLRAHVRETVVAAFCIGETLSGRMFRRCLRAATDPVARDVVRTIVDDETFHGRLGWELAALLMREDEDDARAREERDGLARALPELFTHYRHICCADGGEAWARAECEEADADGDVSMGASPEPPPNFGTLTLAGYALAFYDGMREDVVPGLVAIGFPEAEDAWAMASP